MAKRKPEHKELHDAADYYEPLFRAKFVRAMKVMQSSISINDLAMSMGNVRQARATVIDTVTLRKALQPLVKVLRDARRRGGRLGEKQVRKLG